MTRKVLLLLLSLAFVNPWIPRDALSLDYPTREIEFISGYAPGSSNDNSSRIAAKFGEKYVGRPIIVVNKPGGGGTRGANAIASAKPDGYTLGLLATSLILQPYLMKGVTYHYKKSYRPICQSSYMPVGLYVKKGSPYDMPLQELVKKAKGSPNTIKVGIGGTWSTEDFSRAVFEDEAGIKCIRVPFSGGGGESIPALLGGHTDFNFGGSAHWAPLYKAGKVNVLAMTTEKRDPRFPDIPTFKECGYKLTFMQFYWVVAPAKTPDPIIHFLAEAFKKGFAEQGFKEGMENLGGTEDFAGPEDTLKAMDRMDQLVQGVVKKYDLKPQ